MSTSQSLRPTARPSNWLAYLLGTLALAAIYPTCIAQPIVAGNEVTFDQTTGATSLAFDSATQGRRLSFGKENKVAVQIVDEGDINVSVRSENPVLFAYKAMDIVKTPTDNKQNADTLAGAFAGLAGELKGGIVKLGDEAIKELVAKSGGAKTKSAQLGRGSITRVVVDGIDLDNLVKQILWVMDTWTGAPKTIDLALDPSTVPQAKTAAADWQKHLPDASFSVAMNSVLHLWQKLLSHEEKISWTVEYAQGDPVVHTSNRTEIVADLHDIGFVANAQVYVDMVLMIEQERKTILAQVADIKDLAVSITSIGDNSLTSIKYDIEQNQDLPIEVSANPRFASLLSPAAQAYQAARVGTYTITFAPHEPIHMRPSLGVIYSFVKSPKFTAERDSAGNLKIAGKTDEYAEYSGLVAMEFVSDRYFHTGIQPFFLLGVAPDSDNLGIVLGGGIRAYKSFTFSLGAVYQRVEKLSGTLAIGDSIASEDDLKTDKVFKVGLYLGIGVKLK